MVEFYLGQAGLLTQKVHREKGQVNPDKEKPEMSLSMSFRIHASSYFSNPEIKGSKNSKDSSHTQNVVKMSDYVIGVMESNINPSVCQNNSSKSSNGEQYQKP